MFDTSFCLNVKDIQEWVALHQPRPMMSYRSIKEYAASPDFQYNICQQLLKRYAKKNDCAVAVEKLHKILSANPVIEQLPLWMWIEEHKVLGVDELFGFLDGYFIHSESATPNLYICELKLYVERSDFLPMIQFCKSFDLLYWNGYDVLSEEEKETRDGYYYLGPEPVERDKQQDLADLLSFVAAYFK